MLFSSLTFLFMFLPIFFLWYFTCKTIRMKNIVLLIFSLFFYAWGEPLYILLMIASIAINYFAALLIGKARDAGREKLAKLWIIVDVAVNLGLLGVFKYLGFFTEIINLIPGVSLPIPRIVLPIGISFYTFQIMSYVVDVYRGKVPAQRNIFFLGAYLAAFPQLIAGPVVLYETDAAELNERHASLEDITDGLRRFVMGLAKKVIIANNMALVCDSILEYTPGEYGVIGAWIAVLSYTLQIFCDFSGYSDMAIGLGRMMGFHYLENFNYPYISKSITDFWRRWHISMSTFFRDYVYIPLGGNRVSKPRWIFNTIFVWMLTGLWHGASLNFILWGLYFGVLLLLEKLFYGKYIAKVPMLGHIYAIIAFVYGWVIFRSESVLQIGQITKALVGGYGVNSDTLNIAALLQRCNVNTIFVITFILGVLVSTPIFSKISKTFEKYKAVGYIKDAGIILTLLLCVSQLAVNSYNPFIYFRF